MKSHVEFPMGSRIYQAAAASGVNSERVPHGFKRHRNDGLSSPNPFAPSPASLTLHTWS